jgi:hypothetical protein
MLAEMKKWKQFEFFIRSYIGSTIDYEPCPIYSLFVSIVFL